MQKEDSAPGIIRFAAFEVDFLNGELRKRGVRIKLQDQPLQILRILLENPGRVATREELQKRIWPADTFVDFDKGVYTAITKLREALGDSSDNPRFIETIPRRGYRFIAPVVPVMAGHAATASSTIETSHRQSVPPTLPRTRSGKRLVAALAGSLLAISLGLVVYVSRGRFWPRVKPASGRVMMAVLPFQNLTGDPNQDFFIDGLTEEMITDLGRLNPGRLGVIARTSVMRYKNIHEDIQQVGHVLGVDYVLEGAVRRQHDQVRITAQLIQVRDQTHLWAQSYDRELHDVLAVEDEVARNVADEIRIELTPEERARAGAKVRPEAYEAYLKGRYYFNQRSCSKLKKGLQYFEAARDLEPSWALGYVGVGDSNRLIPMYCETPPGAFLARANAATIKALQIDDSLAEAHASLGSLHRLEYDLEASAREFRQAIQLNPNCVTAHHWYALYLSSQARHEEALAEIDRAIELDPLAPILSGAKAMILFNAHRYQETIQLCHKGIDFDPNWPWFHFWLGAADLESGGAEEALQELRIAQRLDPDRTLLLAGIGYADARLGKKDEALKILVKLKRLSRESHVSSFDFALLYAGMGEKEKSLNWLSRTAEERVSDHLYLINCLPWFGDLRSDPKFLTILRRVGLPQ